MSERQEKQDHYSGIPWVYVSPEEARDHPKGRLSPTLWGIAGYLILAALVNAWVLIGQDVPPGWALLLSSFPLLCGIGLILRAPWAIILATVSAGTTVFQLVVGLRQAGQAAADAASSAPQLWMLFHLLASVGIVFHLMDGDRPNFVYRHRYRKYSVLKERDE